MKENISSKTLSFSCSKKMTFLRTPKDIYERLFSEFNFTIDLCASDENHLCERYYTKETDALKQNWDNEIAYLHPLFDCRIGKFIKKAAEAKNSTIVMLLPASTHTKYFHEYLYKKPNVEIEFLRMPSKDGRRGFRFLSDQDGSDGGKIAYIKPLMIVIMKNYGENC